jgi:dolichol-phosphate mannosyltransferase
MTTKVAVVMPAFNEEAGIPGFLGEITAALDGLDLTLFVADDRSTDGTLATLESLTDELPLTVLPGIANAGHGPTTLRALHAGLASGADVIVAVDGDGQFYGSDIRSIVDQLVAGDADVIEGVRNGRDDPLFRRATSWTTRALVQMRAHARPIDANTPLRVYRPRTLARLLTVVPSDAMTPNLMISALCRRWGLTILEIPVASIPRRGGDAAGSTWRARRKSLPSKRFVQFCAQAGRQWVTLPLSSGTTADDRD